MSHARPIPAKPARITPETLPALFAHHRARFGGWTMTAPTPEPDPPAGPARPDGISEEEWTALGDKGKTALVREREARAEAERKLAAAHARPTPPKDPASTSKETGTGTQPTGPTPTPNPGTATGKGGEPDLGTLVQQAVAAAIKPIQDDLKARDIAAAADRVQTAVAEAATKVLRDPTDWRGNIDLTTVVDENGAADPAKIKTALEELLKAKPHLAAASTPPAGIGTRGGSPAATDAEKVKAALAEMQRATGVRIPKATA